MIIYIFKILIKYYLNVRTCGAWFRIFGFLKGKKKEEILMKRNLPWGERHRYIYLPWDGWKEGKGIKINPKAF